MTGLLDKTELEDEKERCMVRREDPPGLVALLLLLLLVDLKVAEVEESELMPMIKGESSAERRARLHSSQVFTFVWLSLCELGARQKERGREGRSQFKTKLSPAT